MAISTAIAIYVLIWWLTLFAVLPWGVRAQGPDAPAGSDPGAPRASRLWMRVVWTTVVSSAIFGVLALIYVKGWITLDDLARWMGVPAFKQS